MAHETLEPYVFTGNNAVFFIDEIGLYKIPSNFRNRYSHITNHIERKYKTNVTNSIHTQKAFSVATRKDVYDGNQIGWLTGENLQEALANGEGPSLMFTDNPGNSGWASPNGHYDHGTRTIEFKTKILDEIESLLKNGTSEEKVVAIYWLESLIGHETCHYGARSAADVDPTFDPTTPERGHHFEDVREGEEIIDLGEVYYLNSARGDFGIQNYEDAKKVYEAFLINDKND